MDLPALWMQCEFIALIVVILVHDALDSSETSRVVWCDIRREGNWAALVREPRQFNWLWPSTSEWQTCGFESYTRCGVPYDCKEMLMTSQHKRRMEHIQRTSVCSFYEQCTHINMTHHVATLKWGLHGSRFNRSIQSEQYHKLKWVNNCSEIIGIAIDIIQ